MITRVAAAARDVIHERGRGVERRALLIEVRRQERGAAANRSAHGLQLPHQQLDQRGLSATIGTHDADAIAAHDAGREIGDHRPVAEIEPHLARLEHELPRRRRILRLEIDLPQAFAPLTALDAQLLEGADSAFVAGAARFDTLPDPRLFLSKLLVEQGRMLGLDVERSALLEHVVIVTARPADEVAAIELHDTWREPPDERAVVAYEKQSARKVQHHLLEPADGLDIEVVRGLVQEQKIGLRDQRATQHHAPPPAAGQVRHARIARKLETRDHLVDVELRAPLLVRSVGRHSG